MAEKWRGTDVAVARGALEDFEVLVGLVGLVAS
jgi:hypothetical protein